MKMYRKGTQIGLFITCTLLYMQVCSWGDKQMLRSITWKDATDLTGCYAFNAAQDGGQCKPCISHVEQVGILLGWEAFIFSFHF